MWVDVVPLLPTAQQNCAACPHSPSLCYHWMSDLCAVRVKQQPLVWGCIPYLITSQEEKAKFFWGSCSKKRKKRQWFFQRLTSCIIHKGFYIIFINVVVVKLNDMLIEKLLYKAQSPDRYKPWESFMHTLKFANTAVSTACALSESQGGHQIQKYHMRIFLTSK